MRWRTTLAAALAVPVAFHPGSGLADDVTLTSRDGGLRLDGTLLSFDGEFYRVETVYGPLTLDASGVTCEGVGCPDLTAFVAEMTISGAEPAVTGLMPSLIERFAAVQGYHALSRDLGGSSTAYELFEPATGALAARFTLSATSSDEGFADLLAETADAALSLRPVREDEVEMARSVGLGRLDARGRSLVLALDALVPAVSGSQTLRDIAPETLAAIYAGEIVNWTELGGPDVPIAPHLVEATSGWAGVFDARIMAPFGKTVAPGVIRHATMRSLTDAVARDPFAIGIASLSGLGDARAVALRTGSCGFTLQARRDTVKAEDYPLAAPIYVYLPGDRRPPALVREFLAFTQSAAAETAIRASGFVDQSVERTPLSEQGARLGNAILGAGSDVDILALKTLVEGLADASRLSLAFRFVEGSSALDAPSRANVTLLARLLEQGLFDDQTLIFAGFSDGDGGAAGNVRLSQSRAEAVREAVREAAETLDPARVTLRAQGFGEASPLACDETDWGRQVNRRVEVWVRPGRDG